MQRIFAFFCTWHQRAAYTHRTYAMRNKKYISIYFSAMAYAQTLYRKWKVAVVLLKLNFFFRKYMCYTKIQCSQAMVPLPMQIIWKATWIHRILSSNFERKWKIPNGHMNDKQNCEWKRAKREKVHQIQSSFI